MNKQQLVQSLSERLSLPHTQCQVIVNAAQEVLVEALRKKETVTLQGFGVLSPWEQSERTGRNPRTGVSCPIEARVSVKFKPGKFLLAALNEKENECK